jgi:response regulator RpfG family c-di-GMP phosphodiesterase
MDKKHIINVLYVDDEEANLTSFKATFRRDIDVNIFTAISAKDAEKILCENQNIHVLITDLRMPEKLGTELIEDAVKKHPYQSRILITAFLEDKAIKEAEKRELIFRVVGKPWNADELKTYIKDGYDMFYIKMLEREHSLKLTATEKLIKKILKKKKCK